MARYFRLSGRPTYFLTGTDEHGQKVEKAAAARGLSPQEHADQMVIPFQELWKRFEISNDDFIRTTEERHQQVVGAIFSKLYAKGDIYKGHYEGWYCVHEETFYPKNQLVDGDCPECGRPVELLKEESYYFRTSAYTQRLLTYIENNPDFIHPETRLNEVLSFLKGGVQDVSVSRTTIAWGVPVPFDASHTIYVWFDALINYLTGCGYLQDDSKFADFWPPVHVIGKDIIKFHAVIWPCMLMALDIPLPEKIIATGFWTLGEQKISKSRGKVIDPNELADEFGVDAVRYFFVREVPLGQDGEFSRDALIRRINHDLANDLGNLLHRSLPMLEKYLGGVIPVVGYDEGTAAARRTIDEAIVYYRHSMERLDLRGGLDDIWRIVSFANKFIDEAAPWALFKQGQTDRLSRVMYALADCVFVAANLIGPFMPDTAAKMLEQLGVDPAELAGGVLTRLEAGQLTGGGRVKPGAPLFPRIET